jgi:hypothetical protein
LPNPAKPIEQKRLLGNPGHQTLPKEGELAAIPPAKRVPVRPLGLHGGQLWDDVFKYGVPWIGAVDVHLLQMTCEQLDRRDTIESRLAEEYDWHLLKQLNDIEALIAGNLGKLGFSPEARTRLGLAEVKRESKLEELFARRAKRELDKRK